MLTLVAIPHVLGSELLLLGVELQTISQGDRRITIVGSGTETRGTLVFNQLLCNRFVPMIHGSITPIKTNDIMHPITHTEGVIIVWQLGELRRRVTTNQDGETMIGRNFTFGKMFGLEGNSKLCFEDALVQPLSDDLVDPGVGGVGDGQAEDHG